MFMDRGEKSYLLQYWYIPLVAAPVGHDGVLLLYYGAL